MNFEFSRYVKESQERAANTLTKAINQIPCPQNDLQAAMRYSTLNGGKRVRPLLVYAAADALTPTQQTNTSIVDAAAVALELTHAYSLIHDDLPAMDDDKLRRGVPTCHIAFDEATAILAGDALQAQAICHLAQLENCPDKVKLALISELSSAAGAVGMVAGQAIDLAAVDHQLSLDQLQYMHKLKTGRLIRAAVRMGAIATGRANPAQLEQLDRYAEAVGLAFQVQDDILDVTADTDTLGKTQGADALLNKPTYVSLLGLEQAKSKARSLHEEALDAIADFGNGALALRALSAYIVERHH